MLTDHRLSIIQAVDDVHDHLVDCGVTIPHHCKRRDPVEPGRTQKENAEDKMFRLMTRLFAGQKRRLREHFMAKPPLQNTTAKQLGGFISPATLPDDLLRDPETERLILQLITAMALGGVDIWSESISIPLLELSDPQLLAAIWAREHSGEFIVGINDTTRQAVGEAVATFIETPGQTIADLVNSLPFSEGRKLRIAITETTVAFGNGDRIASDWLKGEFPEVVVISTWFTNNDSIVARCPICFPMHEQEINLSEDELFQTGDGRRVSVPGETHIGCRCWRISTTSVA